jgi:hypothetical protein
MHGGPARPGVAGPPYAVDCTSSATRPGIVRSPG